MALTREDLQAIREIMRDETREVVREEVHSQVAPLRTETRKIVYEEVRDQMAPLRNSMTELEQIPGQIQLLIEAQQLTHEKLDTLQKAVDEMAPTITALDILRQMRPHES